MNYLPSVVKIIAPCLPEHHARIQANLPRSKRYQLVGESFDIVMSFDKTLYAVSIHKILLLNVKTPYF